MDEPLFLGEQHHVSDRRATLEDSGTAVWLYLSETDSPRVVADAWVCNRVPAPPVSEVRNYRPGPPPAAEGYAGPQSLCADTSRHTWSLQWSADGESVAVLCDGMALALIARAAKPGHSRLLLRSGPWGDVWAEGLFVEVMTGSSGL